MEKPSHFDLTGTVALVTGASSGIGQRLALALANAGGYVVLVSRRAEELQVTADQVETTGSKAAVLATDLCNLERLPQLADKARSAFGRVDILVNAAGVNHRQSVDEVTLESWHQTLNINLSVPFFLARELVGEMRHRHWGRVINIASLQSCRAFANGLPYGASKGGIVQLTRAMAEAWSANGINCNAIAPGFFPTPLTAPLYDDSEMLSKITAQTAVGRTGQLADLDGIGVFLASPASDYITGQTIYIDGGFTAK